MKCHTHVKLHRQGFPGSGFMTGVTWCQKSPGWLVFMKLVDEKPTRIYCWNIFVGDFALSFFYQTIDNPLFIHNWQSMKIPKAHDWEKPLYATCVKNLTNEANSTARILLTNKLVRKNSSREKPKWEVAANESVNGKLAKKIT